MGMTFNRKLPIPKLIKELYPLSENVAKIKEERDEQIKAIFRGEDKRLLLIIGPCSADREDAVLDYICRLSKVQEKVKDKIFIIPRIYTGKPRTTGEGYKGMLHQPDPNREENMLDGIVAVRRLHTRAIDEAGLVCADEMLYPENYRYLSDILSYNAVGARSVENQEHRLVSSGIDGPVGMKNPTSGDYSVMLNSITAAQSPHMFIYRGWEVTSDGNPYAHAILRGYTNKHGNAIPNYHYEDLNLIYKMYSAKNLKNMSVIVDCNHANSGKQYLEQIRIAKEVLYSKRHSGDLNGFIKGLMIESYIEDGAQKIGEGVYGKSITDPCLGWDKSEKLIYELADVL
ncbi:MAG: 3-deoxy-7-phosphoheptulonate synthase [Ruminiclostridium sp.]|nr:3-deoxy-7-phosphoheptulonate synthase [Ruminiclostridium sp.]